MDLIYGTCMITFILSEYVTGDADDEKSGNLLSGGDAELSEAESLVSGSDVGTDIEPTDTKDFRITAYQEDRVNIYQWHKGIVPYFIDTKVYDTIIVDRIRRAMDRIESVSCLLFKPLHSEPSPQDYGSGWLRITNPEKERDCVHEIKPGSFGEPVMILGFDCMRETEITHSLLHMLGFNDEVRHPQRDLYVRVLWDNIQPKYRHLFAIRNVPTPYHTLAEYDTLSIMHFHDRAFSINGGATIAPLIPGLLIDPSDKLSLLDKMKLRLAFGHECNKRNVDSLFETCKNSLRDEGNDNDDTAGDNSDGGTEASGSDGSNVPSDSDKGTVGGGNDTGTASESDAATVGGSDVGASNPDKFHLKKPKPNGQIILVDDEKERSSIFQSPVHRRVSGRR